MIDKDERRQLYKTLEKRIISGESKSKIYAEYTDAKDAKLVAKIMALMPTAVRRKQFKRLNWSLVAILGILTVIKIAVVTLLVLTEIPNGAIIIFIAPIINLVLIWAVAKFQGFGYLIVIAISINGIAKLTEVLTKNTHPIDLTINITNLVLSLASIIIAAILMKKLLPQTTLFLTPKKDDAGNPIFED